MFGFSDSRFNPYRNIEPKVTDQNIANIIRLHGLEFLNLPAQPAKDSAAFLKALRESMKCDSPFLEMFRGAFNAPQSTQDTNLNKHIQPLAIEALDHPDFLFRREAAKMFGITLSNENSFELFQKEIETRLKDTTAENLTYKNTRPLFDVITNILKTSHDNIDEFNKFAANTIIYLLCAKATDVIQSPPQSTTQEHDTLAFFKVGFNILEKTQNISKGQKTHFSFLSIPITKSELLITQKAPLKWAEKYLSTPNKPIPLLSKVHDLFKTHTDKMTDAIYRSHYSRTLFLWDTTENPIYGMLLTDLNQYGPPKDSKLINNLMGDLNQIVTISIKNYPALIFHMITLQHKNNFDATTRQSFNNIFKTHNKKLAPFTAAKDIIISMSNQGPQISESDFHEQVATYIQDCQKQDHLIMPENQQSLMTSQDKIQIEESEKNRMDRTNILIHLTRTIDPAKDPLFIESCNITLINALGKCAICEKSAPIIIEHLLKITPAYGTHAQAQADHELLNLATTHATSFNANALNILKEQLHEGSPCERQRKEEILEALATGSAIENIIAAGILTKQRGTAQLITPRNELTKELTTRLQANSLKPKKRAEEEPNPTPINANDIMRTPSFLKIMSATLKQ